MAVRGQGTLGARAALACAALYALVLQAWLAGALPHPGPAAAAGVICSHEAPGPGEPGPGQAQHPCCVLACAAQPLLPTPEAEAPRPAPAAPAAEAPRAAAQAARPPPTHHASPRGPPQA